MVTALFTCFGVVVGLVGLVLMLIYVVIPIASHVLTFFGRLVRFVFQEMRSIVLLPIALIVFIVKIIRATLCIVLARWDIANSEMNAAKRRLRESWQHTIAIFIDNPLQLFAIETDTSAPHTGSPMGLDHSKSLHRFKGYTINGTLEPGGSGAKLYIAKTNNNGSSVVIKCFDITSGSRLPQIVRESRAMESAKKLSIVLEHHLDANQFWYVMPYHKGDHLGVVTKKLHKNKSGLTSKQLGLIMLYQQSLLQTLHQYHEAGLWHKDIKPDNIIIHDGNAHLVDLGLVTPLASAMTLTTHGTEYFRDPELVRQAMRGVKVHQIDGSKFDVYGAGAVLYYMLENTFPAHGCLSDFNKQSPEGLRWIVRRAMADYDKRYNSIEEMLLDIEAVLRTSNISNIRPADLPSVNGSNPNPETPKEVRRLPARTTPSTGGGPFKRSSNQTKPLGIVALLVSICIGVVAVMKTTETTPGSDAVVEEAQKTILDYPTPNGRVLVLNDLAPSSDPEIHRASSNILAQLGVAGWDIFIDSETEARVRSWLHADLTTQNNTDKLANENLFGVLVLRVGSVGEVELTLVDNEGVHVFDVVQYIDG